MLINELKRQTSRKFSRQHGRGGKRGKTAGRGTKGQNARSGRKFRPEMRDTIKKLPKLRGYKFNSAVKKPVAINLSQLHAFVKGETVNPKTLVSALTLSIAQRLVRKLCNDCKKEKVLNEKEKGIINKKSRVL